MKVLVLSRLRPAGRLWHHHDDHPHGYGARRATAAGDEDGACPRATSERAQDGDVGRHHAARPDGSHRIDRALPGRRRASARPAAADAQGEAGHALRISVATRVTTTYPRRADSVRRPRQDGARGLAQPPVRADQGPVASPRQPGVQRRAATGLSQAWMTSISRGSRDLPKVNALAFTDFTDTRKPAPFQQIELVAAG